MTLDEIKKEYPYLYEGHMHTSEGSLCAKASAEEMARAYKEHGYKGIFVTNHNWNGNTSVDRSLPWREWVKEFFKAYEIAKKVGDEIGLDVFCAYEAGYGGPEFLIYGITPEWVADHEELKDASVKEQLEIIHSCGGMVIQAHPYREEWYIPEVLIYPDDVDGLEIVNATHSNSKSVSHNNPEFDVKAIELCKKTKLPTTAGSDMHNTNIFGGGMAFKTPLKSSEDFIERVKNKEDYLLTNGEHWYTNEGDLIL